MEEMAVSIVHPDFWQGRRVLLTGHTGFKGSWLALWLLELGAYVYGLSLQPKPFSNHGQSFFSELALEEKLGSGHRIGDIRDPRCLAEIVDVAQPEVVLHLAAQPLVRQSYADPVGTWSTNVQGTLNLLESLRELDHPCSVVLVTTDKVYSNREWDWGYRENDRLGGHDPYSASKAAMELLASSWRASFCGSSNHQTPMLAIATARAGNVIGGGDWALDRIVPDAMRALACGNPVKVRNPRATRPWQHVLEPLAGYLMLAERLSSDPGRHSIAYNFGPEFDANRSVGELVESLLRYWPGNSGWCDVSTLDEVHEAGLLHLVADQARRQLGWKPRWDFATTVGRTVDWYRHVHDGHDPLTCCLADLEAYGALTSGC